MQNQYERNGFEIQIDLSRDAKLTEYGIASLRDRYMEPYENSPQEAFARAACTFADNDEHAQRLYDYASKQWMMFSTPVLCNGGTKKGMPISCFLNQMPDSITGISENYKEDMFMARFGGGIGTDVSTIRSANEVTSSGNKTTGLIPFLKVKDSLMLATQQGANRRGSCAVYLDISHPEIDEFIDLRRQTGSDDRRSRYLHHAVNVPHSFMEAVERDSDWDLVDPKSKKSKRKVKARELWVKILKTRLETGEPYLHFIDTSNEKLPYPLKVRGLRINTSNLCNEIYLPTAPDRSAVCCLSSVNLETWDEWKDDELFIEDMIRMLDNVIEYFIENAPPELWRAVNSARRERSLGLGAMGWHFLLQSKNIAFESIAAISLTQKIFGQIYHQAKAASAKLAEERGEPVDMKGSGYRNAHVIAIAPNATSGIICGETSPSIEPTNNGYTKKTLNGTKVYRNKMLERVLDRMGRNTEDVWHTIITNKGSVQHLDFLDKDTKDVFKTPFEIDQTWVIEQAIVRQQFIDQGQSLNLFFNSDDKSVFSKMYAVHKRAWKGGLKGLYYCRSFNSERADVGGLSILGNQTSNLEQKDTPNVKVGDQDECAMCSG